MNIHLVTEEREIPIETKLASKYSLGVRFLNGGNNNAGTRFSNLVIKNNGDSITLGPCRLIPESNIDGFNDLLVFVKDVYDLESIFLNNKIVSLQSAFLNLPLILAHKKKIRETFKNYTADLSYDLKIYKNIFDNLDSECRNESENVRQSVQQAIIDTKGKDFFSFIDDKLYNLEQIVSDFSKEEHETHGYYFRKQLWDIILCSPFMSRTNLKPRGYAGDSKMMSMLYSENYMGKSIFAKLMHRHPIKHPAAQAVRNRRYTIAKMSTKISNNGVKNVNDKIKILSVACGPAREIQDIISSPEDCRKFHFTLLDQDQLALSEAKNTIDKVEKQYNQKLKVDYLNESVRMILKSHRLKEKWGQFNFVYSMGLFDYLTPPVASAVLGKLYELLSPGGEIAIGNFHVSNPSRTYMEYWLDWVLYYRTENDFKNLFKGDSTAYINVFRDDTGIQMFLNIKKRT